MDAVAPIVFLTVVIAIVGGVVWAVLRYQELQREKMRAIAGAAGLEVDVSTKKPPPLDFDLFGRGNSKKVNAQMWRAGEHDSVFQYRFTEGSGDNSTTYEMTAALVRLPFTAPHLEIATETWWSKIKRVVGMRDIEVESPEFNERYLVRCRDERFAITLLDPPMIAWMLGPYSGSGSVTYEFGGEWMLVYCKQLPLADLPSMLVWAKSVLDQLPVVLTDLYGR